MATAAIFIGLIASYGLAISTGVPGLHPDMESVSGLAPLHQAVVGVGAGRSGEPRATPVFHAPHTTERHDMNTTRRHASASDRVDGVGRPSSARSRHSPSRMGWTWPGAWQRAPPGHGSDGDDCSPTPSLSAKSVGSSRRHAQLWEDHVTWTRLAIISLESGTPIPTRPSHGCFETRPTSGTRSSPTTEKPPETSSPGSCGRTS